MGHVSFTIRGADIASGWFAFVFLFSFFRNFFSRFALQVTNIATIVFDLGESIDTNQIDPHDKSAGTDPSLECPNTIDAAQFRVDASFL